MAQAGLKLNLPQAPSEPSDQASIGALAEKPTLKPNVATTQARPTVMAKLRKLAMVTSLAAVASASLLGGIAYHANKDALHQPTIQLYTQSEMATPAKSAPTTLNSVHESDVVAQQSLAGQRGHTSQPAAVSIYVPSDTVHTFLHDYQNTPAAKAMITEKSEQARKTVENSLSQLKIPDGKLLLDAHVPLPTSEHSLLRIGNLELPSFGLRGLKTETLPMAIEYSTAPIHPHLAVQIDPVKVDQGVRPEGLKGGIFLGAMRVRVAAADGQIPLNGSVALKLDLDGQATQAKLDLLRQGPATPQKDHLIKQMEGRLAEGQRLKTLGAEQGFDSLLKGGFGDQNVDFAATIDTGKGPLSDSTFYMWAAPGSGPDGQPQILVAQQTNLDGLQKLQVKLNHLEAKGQQSDGAISKYLHSKVQSGLIDSIQQKLPELNAQIQKLATARVQKDLASNTAHLQQLANLQLHQLAQRGQDMSVPTHNPLARDIHLGLDGMRLSGAPGQENLVLTFDAPGAPAGTATALPSSLHLQPGQLAVALDGANLNRQLNDQSQGGSVDWKALLGQIRQSGKIHDISFGQDAQGRTVYPKLVQDQGRLAMSFDVVVKPGGLEASKSATGALQSGTGALDAGASKVHQAMKKEGGVVGDVLGHVVQAPFFLLHKVAQGGKAVIDNTVGKVIDAGTEALTSPTIHTHVTVPLNLEVKDGHLTVSPDPTGVAFSDAKSKLPFDILDLLPTRLLSNLIVNTVAESQGPSQLGAKLADKNVKVNLDSLGLKIDQAQVMRGPGQPGVLLTMHTTPEAAQVAAQKMAHPKH